MGLGQIRWSLRCDRLSLVVLVIFFCQNNSERFPRLSSCRVGRPSRSGDFGIPIGNTVTYRMGPHITSDDSTIQSSSRTSDLDDLADQNISASESYVSYSATGPHSDASGATGGVANSHLAATRFKATAGTANRVRRQDDPQRDARLADTTAPAFRTQDQRGTAPRNIGVIS